MAIKTVRAQAFFGDKVFIETSSDSLGKFYDWDDSISDQQNHTQAAKKLADEMVKRAFPDGQPVDRAPAQWTGVRVDDDTYCFSSTPFQAFTA